MDIAGGILILDGNDTADVNVYIQNSKITGYGKEGVINFDYNITNAGKTATDLSYYWDDGGADHLINTADNWNTDITPTSATNVVLEGSIVNGPLVDSSINMTVGKIKLAYLNTSDEAVLTMTGGTLKPDRFYVGIIKDANGVIDLSGGTLQINKDVQLGNYGYGTLNVSGGTFKWGKDYDFTINVKDAVENKLRRSFTQNVQFLNTVIGKMSQVVTDKDEILKKNLKTIAPGIDRGVFS
ncbi:MAG: hypothetical protein A2Y10_17760 [Planctomycetes bacterium GWF2_41_51]|nr:MAG: hypothetical protein A2Y10_17760 [Planctomycetes bacterium GWF2_41_51]HBG25903.1 hypothetical protein [Phycisphaerales bacterium]